MTAFFKGGAVAGGIEPPAPALPRDDLQAWRGGEGGPGYLGKGEAAGLEVAGTADLSACGAYRFALTRRWGAGPMLAAILLNPSTADADRDDPTLARLVRRARADGFGGVRVANLFAWRSPDPRALHQVGDPVGPGNDAAILRTARGAGRVACGWGNGGGYLGRGAAVAAMLRAAGVPLWHLGLTRRGAPRHPLYVAFAVPLQPWNDPT